MIRPRFVLLGLLAAGFGSVASARPPAASGVEQTARLLKRAFSEGDYSVASKALARAVALRPLSSEKEFAPLLRTVAAGLRHRNESIAILAVQTLGRLKVPGSSRYLNELLSVPRHPRLWNLRLAAIQVAGALHEPGSVAKLFKLLGHRRTEFAVGAAQAFAGYAVLKKEERVELVRRLANILGRFEKERPGSRTARVRVDAVKSRLIETLRTLAKDRALADANSARAWVRKQASAIRIT